MKYTETRVKAKAANGPDRIERICMRFDAIYFVSEIIYWKLNGLFMNARQFSMYARAMRNWFII